MSLRRLRVVRDPHSFFLPRCLTHPIKPRPPTILIISGVFTNLCNPTSTWRRLRDKLGNFHSLGRSRICLHAIHSEHKSKDLYVSYAGYLSDFKVKHIPVLHSVIGFLEWRLVCHGH